MSMRETTKPAGTAKSAARSRTVIMASLMTAALASGCVFAKRDHITVGSVPDDYRTNHPIVLQEREQVLDLPVGSSDVHLSTNQKGAVDGLASAYASGGTGPVTILVPAGSANEAAAKRIAGQIEAHLNKRKVANGYITMERYRAGASEIAPIRLSYRSVVAQTGKCGRWPEDILATHENKHYANFGCSYQNNLAAQVANPSDLLGPTGTGPIDAERRSQVITDWRSGDVNLTPNTNF